MLKIELRPGERVRIGEDVVLVMEEKSGQRARLAFSAPSSVKIQKIAETAEPVSVTRAARGGLVL